MEKRTDTIIMIALGFLVTSLIIGYAIHTNWILRDTPLIRAVAEDSVQHVKALLDEGVSINERSRMLHHWTPLICAIFHGRTNMARFLVEAGADVNLANRDGETPLMLSTELRDGANPMVKLLFAHGASLDAKDKYGATVFN